MDDFFGSSMRVTGTAVNYLYVCKRKLWFYMHDITMEQNSDRVEMGKEIHDERERTKRTEVLIDNTIRIDYFDKDLAIHEIKLSKALDTATKHQLLYYLYYLEEKGINCKKGVIHYPKSKRTEVIELTDDDRAELREAYKEINNIKIMQSPPKEQIEKKCKKCSYFELCFC